MCNAAGYDVYRRSPTRYQTGQYSCGAAQYGTGYTHVVRTTVHHHLVVNDVRGGSTVRLRGHRAQYTAASNVFGLSWAEGPKPHCWRRAEGEAHERGAFLISQYGTVASSKVGVTSPPLD